MRKSVNVDFILNNWFGEPPEHSDNERILIRHLYEPLREIERQRDALLEALGKMVAVYSGQVQNDGGYTVLDSVRPLITDQAVIKAVED